ncbi:MAG: extensin family protein [Alcanivorax sp.]|nr:extensin family protein [Alcanivorax sp.]
MTRPSRHHLTWPQRLIVGAFLLLLLVLIVVLSMRPWRMLPPAWNPWAPLAVEHAMTPVTRNKLRRLKHAPAADCQAILAQVPEDKLHFLPLEDYTPVAGCPLTNVVRLHHTSVAFNAPVTMSCPLAVAWVMYEQQALQPLAQRRLGQPLVSVTHMGAFSCRNIYHRENARRSEHATASALDVAAFELRDGRRITVLVGWEGGRREARFLREAHEAACDYFGTVLGPDYNAPHADHFHFGTRGLRFCR